MKARANVMGLLFLPIFMFCVEAHADATGATTPDAYTLDTPPTEVAGPYRDLLAGALAKRRAAATTLATLPEAEPYLRHFRTTAAGKTDAFAGDALDELSKRRGERNVARGPAWQKVGRVDLIVDAAQHLNSDQADKLCERLFEVAHAVQPLTTNLGGPPSKFALYESMWQLVKQQKLTRIHEPDRTVETTALSWGFVRARGVEVPTQKLYHWLFVTRDSLRGTHPKLNDWENCYIFHNGDVVVDDINWSLVICDGDVEVVNWAKVNCSVVIARGSIRGKKGLGFPDSTLYAQGDITATGSHTTHGLLLAGGKIEVPRLGGAKDSKDRVEKAGLKECPFPVRFFETSDVGVEAALKDGALQITKLTPGSPLTKFGVKEGDTVTRVNEKDIKTANDFRRELRYSVALEAGIFHITRGDQKTTRVVYFRNGLEK